MMKFIKNLSEKFISRAPRMNYLSNKSGTKVSKSLIINIDSSHVF